MLDAVFRKSLKAFNGLVPLHKENPLIKAYAPFWTPQFHLKPTHVTIGCEGKVMDLPPFMIGTTAGAFLIENNKAQQILPHYVYGITQKNKNIWIFAQTHPLFDFSRLVEVNLQTGIAKTLVPYLGKRVHQIDVINNHIYVTDTYRNAIIRYDLEGKHIDTRHPFGDLGKDGRSAKNYKHMNSVYGDGAHIHIFCHNETSKTGNASEIATFDTNLKLQNVKQVAGTNGHNILTTPQGQLYCDSLGRNSLNLNDEILLRLDGYLTRGLAANAHNILLGTSLITSRDNRDKGHCSVHVLDYQLQSLGNITIPGTGNIHEIRFMEGDAGLSRNAKLTSKINFEPE
jgi:hypothetical protein